MTGGHSEDDALTPVFAQGSTLRHTLVMTSTGAVGLVAIFIVDFLSLLYVSWLRDPAKTAGVGFATQASFLAMSVNIGLVIAVSAAVGRKLGQRQRSQARRLAGSGLLLAGLTALLVSAPMWIGRSAVLDLFGASGEARAVADNFLKISMPSNVLMAVGMSLQGLMRAVGDARRAMMVTLTGAAATAFLDPLLIFYFDLGPSGAAWAIILARCVFVGMGFWGAVLIHNIVAPPHFRNFIQDLTPLAKIAGPVILTNLATPVSSAWTTRILSQFGQEAVAGFAIIDRISPVAFGVLFALTGAIGPIIAQNFGAGFLERVARVLKECFVISVVYVLAMWALLLFGGGAIADLFHVVGLAREVVLLFCRWGVAMWLGLACLFVANAAFNNLDYAFLATLFNWGRTLVGVAPLAAIGAHYAGMSGVFAGIVVGAGCFGAGAAATAFYVVSVRARLAGDRAGAKKLIG